MLIQEMCHNYEMLQDEIAQGSIYPEVDAETIRAHLSSRYDFSRKMTLDEVIDDVEKMLQQWQVQVTHPRYLGLFNPSVTLASVIADTIVAMYNPQLANWRTSPAANEIERHTLAWLIAKYGLPPESIASFTSGGTEANLSAVVLALTRAFPGYGENGIQSVGAIPSIYLTTEAHNGYNKIAHVVGIGRKALRTVATDESLRLDVDDLARRVAEDRRSGFLPFMVIGTAGTTAAGVIDPLLEIGQFCREHKLWFHADAAWGGAAIISPVLRRYLAGIETADSITCDAHKWLSVPMGAGMLFCRHPDTIAEAFRVDVTYMPGKGRGPVVDPLTSSLQWSRRFIGLKLFMTLAECGESGYVAMIEQQARLGQVFRELLIASDWLILNETPLPLVCFTRRGLDISRFLSLLRERQIAWMTEARVGDSAVVRACITSFRTTESDLHRVVNEMNRLIDDKVMTD